jgi:hypothetical protein
MKLVISSPIAPKHFFIINADPSYAQPNSGISIDRMLGARKPIGNRAMRRDAADLKSTAGRGRNLLPAVYRATTTPIPASGRPVKAAKPVDDAVV